MSFLLLIAAATGADATAPAQNPTELVVAATRLPVRQTDIGANVTVIDRADFDIEKPADLAELLRNVAGVHVDQVGGRGGTGSLYLRGADPNYTLVLVNGVRVNDPTNARGGSFDFSTLDIEDVQRVEIARGPYSAVFGGDALAGVINIVTRQDPQENTHATLGAMGGAYDTREISLRVGGGAGPGNWSLGASDSHQGEIIRGNDFDAKRVSAGYDAWLGDTRVQLSGRYAKSDRSGFPDDSGGYDFAAIRDTEHRDANESVFGAGFTRRLDQGSLALTLGYFDRDEHIDSPGVAPGVRDPFGIPPSIVDSSIKRYTATFTGTQNFGDILALAYGADWQREEGSSDGALDFGGGFVLPTNFALTRTTWAPFAEVRTDFGNGLTAQAGVRVDKPDGYGSVTSPRARVAYEFNAGKSSDLTVAAAWGKAFKLPSMYALGHPIVGNPDLAPERGDSHEIELSQNWLDGHAYWSATWFEGEFRNAIDFDPGPPPKLVNRNRVDTRGIEFTVGGNLSDALGGEINATHATSRIASSGNDLRNRPEWRAGASVHWTPFAALKLSAGATYVGSSLDSSIATGDLELAGYTRIDVSASWQVNPKLETYLAVDNLTDKQYEQFVGFEERGIAPRAGVRLSF